MPEISPRAPVGAQPLPAEFVEALDRVRLRLGVVGSRVLYFPTVGSTNDVASALAGVEGLVAIADEQTAGRGRRGRTWFSPPGSGLYVSVVLAPGRAECDPERATAILTLAAGVALAEAVETTTGLAPDLKWPNDLYVGRRKLAGILAEGVSAGAAVQAVILGYGINIGPMAYPPELAARATALEAELGRPIDRALVAAETLARVAERYADLRLGRFDAILDAWRDRAPASRGARVSWQSPSGPQTGTTIGIDDRGALLVRVGSRVERIVAGALTWE